MNECSCRILSLFASEISLQYFELIKIGGSKYEIACGKGRRTSWSGVKAVLVSSDAIASVRFCFPVSCSVVK